MNPFKRDRSPRRNTAVGDVMFVSLVGFLAAIIVALFLAAIAGGVFAVKNALQRDDVAACVVTDKEAVSSGSGNDYRVYTQNCGVFTVTDSVFAGRWDAADTYNDIEPGVTYDFHTQGGRYPFFSMFPNVLELEVSQ